MNNVQDKVIRNASIMWGFEETVAMLKSGIAVFQAENSETKAFVPMLLLSNGLERFMKVLLILQAIESNKTGLTKQQLKELGHNLNKLRNQVLDRCYSNNFKKRPYINKDFDFLKNDADVIELFEILNDFANTDRYIFLDATAEPENLHGEWPERRWESLATKYISTQEFIDEKNPDRLEKLKIKTMTILLERIIRAFSRLLFSDALVDLPAKSLTVWVNDFIKLADSNLGEKIYTVQ